MTLRTDASKNRERILELAREGLTAEKIARKVRLHPDTVYRHLASAGVKTERPPARCKIRDLERMRWLVDTHGVTETARRLKVSRQAVYLRMRGAR